MYENFLSEMNDKHVGVSVIGLGYVGLPLAIEMAKKYKVIGFDINQTKIEKYLSGIDITEEVGDKAIQETALKFTSIEKDLRKCKFHIIAVPTPINTDKTPDLNPVISASKTMGRNLTKGSIVVYESTVYPGTTEEICIPVLEEESGLKCGIDFKVGYSPERINPGDKVNTLTKIIKIVSGSDEEALKIISDVYGSVITAGIHKAESIKVAEAAKVIENAQRDINIAFMNELSMAFNRMGISTKEVLSAASTKWNFLNFTPGLVGGHCIGVDPYYFTYKAEQLGYHSQIIAAGRKINDDMGRYVANNIVKELIKTGQPIKGSKVAILGITFKENCPDVRNTKVIDIIEELESLGISVVISDPWANESELWHEKKIKLVKENEITDVNAIVLAVPHDPYKKYEVRDFERMYKKNFKVFIDIKGLYNSKDFRANGFSYWSL